MCFRDDKGTNAVAGESIYEKQKERKRKKRNASQRSDKPVFQAEQYSAISVQYTAEPLIKYGQRERGIRKKKKTEAVDHSDEKEPACF